MHLYNSYIKKTHKGDIEDLIFVKNGFSPVALFFNFIWFSSHKMTKAVIYTILAIWALTEIFSFIGIFSPLNFLLAVTCSSLVIATNGNFWYSKYLRSRDYEFVGCFFGNNKEEAKLRFVEQYIGEVGESTIARYKFLDKQDRDLLKMRWKKEEENIEKEEPQN